MRNLYREMKNKYKIQSDDSFYQTYIDGVTSLMFVWDEKIFRPELFDRMLRDAGIAALIKTETSDYTPVWCFPVDGGNGRYADGWFKDCKCYDFTGKEYSFSNWMDNPDILVFFNDGLRNPDNFNAKYAEALSDIDFSIKNNVHYSRMHPVPVAKNKKTKARIDQCIKDVSNGEFNTVLTETSIEDVIDGVDDIKLLNITDVTKSEYIQYLSHLHDAYIARLFFLLGLGTTDNGKQAQVTIAELNKNEDASIAMALNWYTARKKAIDVAKSKGHELSFDFHPLWKVRYEQIINPPELESTTNEEQLTEEQPTDEGSENVNEDRGDSDN